MDVLRGLAIIFVVVLHAQTIPEIYGFHLPKWVGTFNDFFTGFRMPALVFLSGMLLSKSLGKSLKDYSFGKFSGIVWPYLVWAFIFLVIGYSEHPISSPRGWIATGYLWFLFYLAAYYFVAPALKRLPLWVAPVGMLLASLPLDTDESPLKNFLYLGAFFFTGHATHMKRVWFERLLTYRWALLLLAVGVAYGIFSLVYDTRHKAEFAPFVLAGIIGAIYLVRHVESFRFMAPVRYIGRNSLVFYVSHFPLVLVLVYGVVAMGGIPPWAVALSALIMALLGGWVFSAASKFLVVGWLFKFPLKAIPSRRFSEVHQAT